ncbi:Predicted amidophosphoribosyltransferases [Humidesulfovibrio mexicanus]|uniref:Predicted amidophosphoribosyltransferases n=1 Tax=Humidesulfovibrio mexicanus TaxID=147047 RepID=A0A239BYP2_9BACT|nr:hypothetical protein [Humidesulfovibrio mexicanus]SNS12204.1 Predicted amidophosphoribosyltransferases [Humidesulfovibrio mexicanus]
MLRITSEYFSEQEAKSPTRRSFAQNTGIQKNKKPGACKSFSVRFKESIAPIYEAMTSYSLRHNPNFDNYWHPLHSDADVFAVEEWERQQGTRVFLRDCLSCSIALDYNFTDNTSGIHTAIGQLEYEAKSNNDASAIGQLGRHLSAAIQSLPFYKNAPLVAAVPARPGKTSPDLPTALAKQLAASLGLTDLTPHFQYYGPKAQLKELPLDERWAAWEGARLSMSDAGAALLKDHSVILIDDKYQSGVSANFVAMILQQHGAAEIYGLYAVKTLRDKDNT